MKISKKIAAVITALAISSTFGVSAFAVSDEEGSQENSKTEVSQKAETAAVEENGDETEKSKTDENPKEQTEESDDSEKADEPENYLFSDNTEGNADLLASQEVIADDGEFQFIAVTTRDQDTFYVIIDHSKAENNVYFLNEVDTYDLKALLSKNNESNENGNNSNSNEEEGVAADEEAEDEAEDEAKEKSTSSASDSEDMTGIILIVGVAALAGIGFVIYKIKKGGFGKKNSQPDLLDDDFDDDDEINEDKEEMITA